MTKELKIAQVLQTLLETAWSKVVPVTRGPVWASQPGGRPSALGAGCLPLYSTRMTVPPVSTLVPELDDYQQAGLVRSA